jgi:hypothetical protein
VNTVRRSAIAVALAAGVVGVSACGSSTPAAAPSTTPAASSSAASAYGASSSASASASSSSVAAPAAAATGTLTAADQSSDGKSVVVAAVDLKAGSQGGWIALHMDVGGKPGPVKYEVAIPAGASMNVKIPTPGGITTGAYWPMLHVDDHTIGTYEFPQVPGADLPAMAGGKPVMQKITVTVS